MTRSHRHKKAAVPTRLEALIFRKAALLVAHHWTRCANPKAACLKQFYSSAKPSSVYVDSIDSSDVYKNVGYRREMPAEAALLSGAAACAFCVHRNRSAHDLEPGSAGRVTAPGREVSGDVGRIECGPDEAANAICRLARLKRRQAAKPQRRKDRDGIHACASLRESSDKGACPQRTICERRSTRPGSDRACGTAAADH